MTIMIIRMIRPVIKITTIMVRSTNDLDSGMIITAKSDTDK